MIALRWMIEEQDQLFAVRISGIWIYAQVKTGKLVVAVTIGIVDIKVVFGGSVIQVEMPG